MNNSQGKKQALALTAMVLALCVVVVGCGGGDDDEEPTSISKAEYVKRADDICANTEKSQRKLLKQFTSETKASGASQKAIEESITFAALPPMSKQIEEFAELPPPSTEAGKAKEYLSALEKGLKAAEKEPGTLLINPGAFTKAEEVAKEFGFKNCLGA